MRIKTLFRLLTIAALVLFVIPSCVKEGPPGMDGIAGADGVDGQDGADGADGTAFCMECHNNTTISGFTESFEMSGHVEGTSWARGSSSSCARCHSNEGFIAFAAGGSATGANPLTCNACHTHGEVPVFQDENEDPVFIRTTAPVTLMVDETLSINLEGNTNANLCANCHQARRTYEDFYGDPDENGLYEIGGHYGPHHSPQVNMLIGIGGFEFQGTTNYPSSGATSTSHAEGTCIACHMSEENHAFAAPTVSACVQCHGSIDDMDVNGEVSEIEDMMTQLAGLLETNGAVTITDGVVEINEGDFVDLETLNALWNFAFIHDDMSGGVHNPAYTKALLSNTIEALQQ